MSQTDRTTTEQPGTAVAERDAARDTLPAARSDQPAEAGGFWDLALERAQGDFQQLMRICDALSRSSFVPKEFQGKPGDVLAAIDLGRAVGLSSMSALQSIAPINGRPALYGDGQLAVILAHGGYLEEAPLEDGEGNVLGWRCVAHRAGRPPVVRQFTRDDAQRAQLLNSSPAWKRNESRMLQMRSRGFACRDQYADWLRGISFAADPRDVIDADYSRVPEARPVAPVEPIRAPDRGAAAAGPGDATASRTRAAPASRPTRPESDADRPSLDEIGKQIDEATAITQVNAALTALSWISDVGPGDEERIRELKSAATAKAKLLAQPAGK